jgi:His/Glu/Gln/Arg/opine family amino acid ABC transporter permease subunit
MTYLFSPDNWEWLWTGNNFRFLLEGFAINVQIAAVAMVLALALGLMLALLRISKLRLISVPVGIWVDVFRNLPVIFLILYLFLGMPESWRNAYVDVVPDFAPEALQSGFVLAGILGLVLYNSAVLAEIMRSGILSLERGQSEAAYSLGLTYSQAMRLVILPQGLRRMVPATVSQLITLNKDTTLVSIIAIGEVVRHGRTLSTSGFFGETDAPVLQVFIVIGLMFIAVNLLLSRLSRRLEIRERKRTAVVARRVTGVEDQVAAETDLAERFMTAIAERDMDFLERHLGEEFVLITGRPGHETRSRAEWLEVTASAYEIRSFRFDELEVLDYGDVGVVRSRYSQEATMGGADRTQTYLMTDVWHRSEGDFRLTTRHISPL